MDKISNKISPVADKADINEDNINQSQAKLEQAKSPTAKKNKESKTDDDLKVLHAKTKVVDRVFADLKKQIDNLRSSEFQQKMNVALGRMNKQQLEDIKQKFQNLNSLTATLDSSCKQLNASLEIAKNTLAESLKFPEAEGIISQADIDKIRIVTPETITTEDINAFNSLGKSEEKKSKTQKRKNTKTFTRI